MRGKGALHSGVLQCPTINKLYIEDKTCSPFLVYLSNLRSFHVLSQYIILSTFHLILTAFKRINLRESESRWSRFNTKSRGWRYFPSRYATLPQRPTNTTIQLEKSLGTRPVLAGTVEEIRAGYSDLLAMLAPQMPKPSDAVSTKDGEVDGVKYRVYTPVEAAKSGPLPVGVYTHGGGLVVGDLDGEDICTRTSPA
jgi:hypothetical protein